MDSAPMRQPVAANQREFKEPLLIKGLIWAAILRTPVPAEQQSATKHGRLRDHGEPVGARRWSGIAAVARKVRDHETDRGGDDQHQQRDEERVERLGADRPQDDPDDEPRDKGEQHAHCPAEAYRWRASASAVTSVPTAAAGSSPASAASAAARTS